MSGFRKVAIVVGTLVLGSLGVKREAKDSKRGEIDAFNNKFLELHLKMDTPGIMAMWAEDGVDLMQGEAPIVGRKTITAWIENVLSKMRGYKVTKQELVFHDIQVCGDWATEWATEHQLAQSPEGKPNFDGYGKIALMLHREASGEWQIKQEMWNASPKPLNKGKVRRLGRLSERILSERTVCAFGDFKPQSFLTIRANSRRSANG
jgi:ketosteroid isomerase-like protein